MMGHHGLVTYRSNGASICTAVDKIGGPGIPADQCISVHFTDKSFHINVLIANARHMEHS